MTKTTKLMRAFSQGRTLTVAQIKKMGIANPTAHVSYIRNELGARVVTTRTPSNKTAYRYAA